MTAREYKTSAKSTCVRSFALAAKEKGKKKITERIVDTALKVWSRTPAAPSQLWNLFSHLHALMLTSPYCIIGIICILAVFLSLFPSLLSIYFTAGRYFFFPLTSSDCLIWIPSALLRIHTGRRPRTKKAQKVPPYCEALYWYLTGERAHGESRCEKYNVTKKEREGNIKCTEKHSKFHPSRNISELGLLVFSCIGSFNAYPLEVNLRVNPKHGSVTADMFHSLSLLLSVFLQCSSLSSGIMLLMVWIPLCPPYMSGRRMHLILRRDRNLSIHFFYVANKQWVVCTNRRKWLQIEFSVAHLSKVNVFFIPLTWNYKEKNVSGNGAYCLL